MPQLSQMHQNWIKAIRQHALKNYEHDGWDVLVECWFDEDIIKAWGNAKYYTRAFNEVHTIVKRHDDIRRDVQGEVF